MTRHIRNLFRSMEVIVTDNKNAYAAIQEENKNFEISTKKLKSKVSKFKEEINLAEKLISELKDLSKEAEKKNTVLNIKLETAIDQNSSLSEENSILNRKLEDITNNIGNAESRSEQVKFGSIVKCIKSEIYKFEILNMNRQEQEF